jgi:hypothetical protein
MTGWRVLSGGDKMAIEKEIESAIPNMRLSRQEGTYELGYKVDVTNMHPHSYNTLQWIKYLIYPVPDADLKGFIGYNLSSLDSMLTQVHKEIRKGDFQPGSIKNSIAVFPMVEYNEPVAETQMRGTTYRIAEMAYPHPMFESGDVSPEEEHGKSILVNNIALHMVPSLRLAEHFASGHIGYRLSMHVNELKDYLA